jgi:EmrB/QacA subfamily drug resistance transporter
MDRGLHTTPAAATSAAPSALATRRGRLTLALLCTVAFLDFVDASIVNVALPSIREDLHFSVQSLQWVLSGYLLTYGGFMLLGGRAADLFGRRRVLVAGTTLFALSSLRGGLAQSEATLVGARLAQGMGAAMMLPAALSLLTTTFTGSDRHKALGVWGGVAGLASAVGVLLGGVLSEGPGWRWVLLVNEPVCLLALASMFWLLHDDRRRPDLTRLDLRGAFMSTFGMLLLVYTLVKAPDAGWGAGRTIGGLAAAAALLAAFVVNEQRSSNPLLALSIFRVKGLAAADVTQLIGIAGIISMFFFLTLYMQNVLGYSQIETGLSYLPLCFGVGIAAGIASQLLAKVGTRPVMVAGALLAAGGVFWLSHLPVGGSYAADMLPGLLIASFGLGAVFVAVTTAANEGVPPEQAGLAAALLNASQQVGGALGLAVFSAIAAGRTDHLPAGHTPPPEALTSGFQRALLACSICLAAAAIFALRTSNTRGETAHEDEAPSRSVAVSEAA